MADTQEGSPTAVRQSAPVQSVQARDVAEEESAPLIEPAVLKAEAEAMAAAGGYELVISDGQVV